MVNTTGWRLKQSTPPASQQQRQFVQQRQQDVRDNDFQRELRTAQVKESKYTPAAGAAPPAAAPPAAAGAATAPPAGTEANLERPE